MGWVERRVSLFTRLGRGGGEGYDVVICASGVVLILLDSLLLPNWEEGGGSGMVV